MKFQIVSFVIFIAAGIRKHLALETLYAVYYTPGQLPGTSNDSKYYTISASYESYIVRNVSIKANVHIYNLRSKFGKNCSKTHIGMARYINMQQSG